MCSDAKCSKYAYQYTGEATELPGGESPDEGTTSFYEMPGSLPRVELESFDTQISATGYHATARPYTHVGPAISQTHYKASQNAALRKAVPMSISNLSQLPRLDVPQSQHCVPRLISDCSPLTPSPISPITPTLGGHHGYSNATMHLDAISPCTMSKQDHVFAHYGSWDNRQALSPATPSTATSYGSSIATTPVSAYPSSTNSSFHHWPQVQRDQRSQMYPQTFLHPDYAQNVDNTSNPGPSMWQNDIHAQPHDFSAALSAYQLHNCRMTVPVVSQPQGPPAHAPSCYEKQNYLARAPQQPTLPEPQCVFQDAPPAYSPVDLVTRPPPTNTQRRYPPSVCQHCGKIFTGKYGPGNCKRHVQQTHESIVDRAIHLCKLCMKTYNRADALRKHQWKKHRLEHAKPHKRREKGLRRMLEEDS